MKLYKYFKLTPFDESTESGRSDERYRLAFLSMIVNVLARCATMVVMLLTVSLTIPYLGSERFGIWMTIASLVGFLSFLDFGVGNALTNKVSETAAKQNADALRSTISGGLGFLMAIGLVMGGILVGIVQVAPWNILIKLDHPEYREELLTALNVFSILFGLSIFTTGIQRIFSGMQRAFESHLVSLLGSLISLGCLLIAAKTKSSIPVLLAATFGVQSITNLGLLIVLRKRGLFTLQGITTAAKHESPSLIKLGGLFFLLQIGMVVGWGGDSLIISSSLGAKQVATFALVQKLYQFVTQPMSIMNAPLWGAYADAQVRGEGKFIRKTLLTSIRVTLIYSTIAVIFILIFGRSLVGMWTSNSIDIPFQLLLAYGIWSIIDSIGNSVGIFMNGCGIVRPQVWNVASLIIFSIPIKIITIDYFGLPGMIFSFVAICLVNDLFWYGCVFRKNILFKLYEK